MPLAQETIDHIEPEIIDIIREHWLEDPCKSNYVRSSDICEYTDKPARTVGKMLKEVPWAEKKFKSQKSARFLVYEDKM